MPSPAACRQAKRHAKHCVVVDALSKRKGLMWSRPHFPGLEFSATWKPRAGKATGSSCTMCPSARRIIHLTASATEWRWASTMCLKLTYAVDFRGRIPICRLRPSWRTKSISMTIPAPTGRIEWLRPSRERCCGFLTTFLIGLHRRLLRLWRHVRNDSRR